MNELDEILQFITEYEIDPTDDIVDILKGRVHHAIYDQLNHMIKYADFDNPNKIKNLVLRDINDYIDSFEYQD